MIKVWKRTLIAIAFILLLPALGLAETDPRDSIPLPPGSNLGVMYWRFIDGGNVFIDGRKVGSANLSGTLLTARYMHYSKLGDMPVAFGFYQPFGKLNFRNGSIHQQSSGLADITFNADIWTPDLIGKPDNNFWMGFGGYVTAPTGDYDSEKAVSSLGSNRWTAKGEVGLWIWRYKRFVTEGIVNVSFYTDNYSYSSARLTQKMDPLYNATVHASYNITKDFWIGISYLYYLGAETKISGIAMNDRTETSTIKFTGSLALAPNMCLTLQFITDVAVKNGIATNIFGGGIYYVW